MKAQSSQQEKPLLLEFGKDTVYVRDNIVAVKKEKPHEFKGWQYEEEQYTYQEYAKMQQQENDNVKLALVELASIVTGG